jgi:hypothetical protein
MKTILCLLFLGNCLCVRAQIAASNQNAQIQSVIQPFIRDWKITLEVVDENGQPVVGAKASVGNSIGKLEMSGLTDTNGIFIAAHHDAIEEVDIYAGKNGYYSFQESYHLMRGRNHEFLNSTQTLVLKKIIKPIPMYAKTIRTHVPDVDKPIGYDLMVGDWVGPYGHGIKSDFLFAAHFSKPTTDESDFTLTVSFPNHGDGIQDYISPTHYLGSQGSALRSNEEAPTNNYQLNWIQTDNRGPGHPVETNRDLNRNYYFRVRTKVDDNGNIVSAHYGKIYGDFMTFTYYLNPTPNSRNVEFDPKQNLMTNLKPDEGVSAP